MPENRDKNTTKIIPFNQLAVGMYVIEITSGKKGVSIKSEGFVSNADAIKKLQQSGVTHVTINPDKDKNKSPATLHSDNNTEVHPPEKKSPEKSQKHSNISLEHEMKNASTLYSNAKALQSRILLDMASSKSIDMLSAQEQTDAIVDSIFRNQDALACMARLRMKNEYLIEHSLNVSILMTIFAKYLGESRESIEQLALGAFLHDIGKIKVPDEILNKPGKLTDTEYEVMQRHVTWGVELLTDSPHISHVAMSMVKEHHERLDGSGYPVKLKSEQISQYGRMIAIVDSYDAMTAERIFKPSMHPSNAFKRLKQATETHYDKLLVEKFIQCLGVYPVGTLVKLTSGKLGLVSGQNPIKPLCPLVKVFYNTRMNQAIPIQEIDLSLAKSRDQIECSIKPEAFNINLLGFFKMAFID